MSRVTDGVLADVLDGSRKSLRHDQLWQLLSEDMFCGWRSCRRSFGRPWPWRQEPQWKSSGRRSSVVATSAITFSGAVCSSHLEISLVVCSGRQAAEFGRALAGSDATRARELAALEVDVARFQSPAASAHREIVGRHKLVESSR